MRKERDCMKDLMIIGASGFGREVAWLTERINEVSPSWNLKGFIDDNEALWGTEVDGIKVLGGCDHVASYPQAYYVCAVAASKTRKRIIGKLKTLVSDIRFATLIDPSVIVSERAEIGNGSVICAGSIISVDLKIMQHVIVDWNCTVGHDVTMESFVTLYPNVNVSGNTKIEECVELGTGTQIIQGKTIGRDTIVGAGSVVVRDLPSGCTAVGIPAKPIK